ncbi:hypothetical protein BJ878DRAFT_45621 [Calycina marina]|uniref:Uncharacterized protein n=1 Tax=Calycina marina TaxID=1763456 RepID=A0A9P7ZAP9_9HELO|nr:hypothetical protein BJ878DRAFT_45621 [Calycina marina]
MPSNPGNHLHSARVSFFLTCLLYDIGTTGKNITAKSMSFVFHGSVLVLDFAEVFETPIEQAENVAEAVIRHQDLGDTGRLTRIGGLIRLTTIFDNMGGQNELVAKETIESVIAAFPRIIGHCALRRYFVRRMA